MTQHIPLVVKKMLFYDGKLHRLTPTEVKLLSHLTVNHNRTKPLSKREYSEVLGCNIKTFERTIASLKRRGLLEVTPRFGESGGQLSNCYRLSEKMEIVLLAQQL